MLELKKISTYHGYVPAVRDVSIDVRQGEVLSLLGANGAGKTSLLMTVSGIYRPKSGTIVFQGREIQKAKPGQIVRMGISHSPEDRKLFGKMSVLKNLRLGAFTRTDGQVAIGKTLGWVYEIFPILRERAEQMAETLSGGEQKMLAIGRALMADPKLLVLDEPSLGLAPIVIRLIMDTVKAINEAGKTILMVEQNASAALRVAHRGYVMEAGRVVLEGDKKSLMENEGVKQAYLGA
ncbi:MAG: ABC transporter ATP-binding protein [Pseudomonadota bacterium]